MMLRKSELIDILSLYGIAASLLFFIQFFILFILSGIVADFSIKIYTNKFGEFYPEVVVLAFAVICNILGVIKFCRLLKLERDNKNGG